ncbi:hypothetical protein TYRP_022337 [Tyrophagus putrescentiae]|nr:hypothetical protein TYRP_022337 [Tyrophagus putrescentiae]
MNANAFAFFSSSTSPIFAGSTCSHHPSPVRYASTCIFQQVQFAAVSFSIPVAAAKSRAGGTAQSQSRCFCSSSEPVLLLTFRAGGTAGASVALVPQSHNL